MTQAECSVRVKIVIGVKDDTQPVETMMMWSPTKLPNGIVVPVEYQWNRTSDGLEMVIVNDSEDVRNALHYRFGQ